MKQAGRQRIDQLLVDRGLVESRTKAQALILAGNVLVNEQKITRSGQTVPMDASVRLLHQLPFVSRGGVKLDYALKQFAISAEGRVCLDIGSSTGGFVDCLLQRGARRVYSVDVGDSQLDWKLRTNPNVIVKDHTNARFLELSVIGEHCGIVVCDVSFISVTMIVPVIPSLLTSDGDLVILIKPQFEAGRDEVGKGGIVRDPAAHEKACRKVQDSVESAGLINKALIESPILGTEGNREFLLHAGN